MAGLFDDVLESSSGEASGLFDDILKSKPVEGGLIAAAKSGFGSAVKGAGQAAGDFIPGVSNDNALKRYGQGVIDANPTAVRGFDDLYNKPWTAIKEAIGNAGGSVGQIVAARAIGQGITAAAPLTGPLAPVTAAVGQAIAWFGPAAIAALPSYGSIRDKQILNDPASNEDWKSKAIATLGAGAVGAIEAKFGPQEWALGAMSREGRSKLAEKFAETTLAKGIGFGALKGAAIEGAEELVQNPIEQLASYEDPTSSASLKETAFGGVMGAIGGGVLGGATGAVFRSQPLAAPDRTADIVNAPGLDEAIVISQQALDEVSAPLLSSGFDLLSGQATNPLQEAMSRPAGDRIAAPTNTQPADLLDRQLIGANPLMDVARAREDRAAIDTAIRQAEEARVQSELDAIPVIAEDQNTTQGAVQRAATLEAPTALELAFQRARQEPTQATAPLEPATPEAPTAPVAEPPRLIDRATGLLPMSLARAEQVAAKSPDMEVVRFPNINRDTGQPNGKFSYTVITKETDGTTGSVRAVDLGADGVRGNQPGASSQLSDGATPDAPATPVAAGVQADEAKQPEGNKAKWLKAINDHNRLAGDTGIQLKVVDGKLTFFGDPRSSKQGQALAATMEEAKKAGATIPEIIASIQSAQAIPAPGMQDQPGAGVATGMGDSGLATPAVDSGNAGAGGVGGSVPPVAGITDAGRVDAVGQTAGERPEPALRRISIESPVVGRPGESNPTIVDAQGNAYRVHSQRNHLVIAHPIVDGKPVVNSGSAVRFWTNPDMTPSGGNDRIDPIFQPGANASTTSGAAAPASPAPAVQAEMPATGNKLSPVAVTTPAVAPQDAGHIGANNIPIAEGGKPFKTKQGADLARKMNPMLRAKQVQGGYVLVPKTEKQLAAEAVRAKRLSQPRTSPTGEPIPAHAFIASEGGLSKMHQNDLGVDGNPKIGNRWLFSALGRGLSIEQATEKLVAEQYLPEGATHNDAYALIRQSLSAPRYNADGIERIAEAEQSTRFDDHLAAQEEAAQNGEPDFMAGLGDIQAEDVDVSGYSDESDPIKMEVAALLAQAEALDIDTDAIKEDAFEATRNGSEQDYYEAQRSQLQSAIEKGAGSLSDQTDPRADSEQGRETAVGQGGADRGADTGQQGGAAEPILTAPTRGDILAQQDRAEATEKQNTSQRMAAEKQAAQDEDRKRIAKASEAAASTFTLGGDAMDNLTGQGSIFDAPEPSTPAKPAAEMSASELLRAAADKMDAEKAAPSKIEDAGEKIGGARKDRWKERGLNLSDLDSMTESEGSEMATKANVWKPDWMAMAESADPVTAAMVKTVYDQLAAKPKKNTPDGRRNYVTMMQAVRKVYLSASTPQDAKEAGTKIKQEIGLYSTDPVEKARAREVLFSVYKGRSDPFVMGYNELSKAKKLVEDGFPEKGEPWKKRLIIRALGGQGVTPRGIELMIKESAGLGTPLTSEQILAGYHRISSKDGKTVAYAASKEDAEATAKTIYERDLKNMPSGKAEPARPHLDRLARENLPDRMDRDVTADDFVNDLGFRGVEFGNWAAQDERQRIINMAYDGLMDLAEIMGVPPKAMSLNGTMGLAFGARGGGKFAAHYEPGRLVINMTKINGGGSMAHEWAHALDHYFGELNQKDAYTTNPRGASGWYSEGQYQGIPLSRMEKINGQWVNVNKRRLDNLRPEMAKAFDGLMSALFSGQETKAQMVRGEELKLERTKTLAGREIDPDTKAMYERMAASQSLFLKELRQDPEDKLYPKGRSAFAGEAQKLSGKSTNGYWTRPTEMFARAFESWVFDKVAAMGAKSDYLVHGVEADRFAGGQYKGNPYPTGAERANINAAFDKLAETIQTKETERGTMLFSRGGRQKSQLAEGWMALAQGDGITKSPRSSSTDLPSLFAEVAPGFTVTQAKATNDMDSAWRIYPNGKPYQHGFVLVYKDGRVELNLPRLNEGDGGSAAYAATGNWALNTGRKFAADRYGLSRIGAARRLENLASLAVKFGTTKFIDIDGSTLGIEWTDSDQANIENLLTTSYDRIKSAIPEIDNYAYDFTQQQFVSTAEGDAGVRIVADPAAELVGAAREAGLSAGSSTIQRAILTGTLIRGQDLLQAVRETVNQGLPGNLNGLLYGQAQSNVPSTPIATIRESLSKAYGKLSSRLEAKGLLSIHQTQGEAMQAAAQARADARGTDLETELAGMQDGGTNQSMTNSDVVGNQGGRSADDSTPGATSDIASLKAELSLIDARRFAITKGMRPRGSQLSELSKIPDDKALRERLYYLEKAEIDKKVEALTRIFGARPVAIKDEDLPPVAEGHTRYFHNSHENNLQNDGEGRFNGLFSSLYRDNGYGNGRTYYSDIVDTEKADRTFSGVSDAKILVALKKVMGGNYNYKYRREIWQSVIEDIDPSERQSLLYSENKIEFEKAIAAVFPNAPFQIGGSADASWEAQRIRGKVGFELGYSAIPMRDDLGVSYLIKPGIPIKKAFFIQNESTAPTSDGALELKRSDDGRTQGFYDPITAKSFLIADNLTSDTAPGVLIHEIGIHAAADGTMDPLHQRAADLVSGDASDFMRDVANRMDAAGETSAEEAAAYIAEAYENNRLAAPKSVRQWVADYIAAIRGWLYKKGILIASSDLTPADIAAIARANARAVADGGAQAGEGGLSLSESGEALSPGADFWRKIKAGESFTAKELEDVYSKGRRGAERAMSGVVGKAIEVGTGPGEEVAAWAGTIAGFDGYRTVGVATDDGAFVVGVIPEEIFRGRDQGSVESTAIVSYRFIEVGGKYRLDINDADPTGEAFAELHDRGTLEATGQRDADGEMYFRAKLEDRYTTSRALLQEAVRRLALHIGEVPAIVQGDRETGARADVAGTREFGADRVAMKFSRAAIGELKQQAQSVYNAAANTPGKLGWWHKTVGTQYNLAQRSPEFKRVYDAVQSFLNDVSFFATESADLAPTILPKLENWRDIAKSPLSAADTKAIAAPIFEGTLTWIRDESGKPVKVAEMEDQAKALTSEQKAQRLLRNNKISANVLKMWQGMEADKYDAAVNSKYDSDMLKAGVVWTPSELQSLFKLTGEKQDDGTWSGQIGLYQEFRKATDKSLTHLALSDMLYVAGDDAEPIRDAVLASATPMEAAETIQKYLLSVAEYTPDRNEELLATADTMIDKAAKVQDLIDRGYAPLSRFGNYTLDVVDADGERVYFGLFEGRFEAEQMAKKMREMHPGASMTQGTLSEQSYKLFSGVSPETVALFGGMMGLDGNPAYQEYIKLAKSSRSAMKRLIERKGIAGFSEDAGRVLAGFVYSNARQTSQNLHAGEMSDAANAIPQQQGELKDHAVNLVEYIKNPQQEAQQIRGLLFAQYIGGSVASAMVNMTQPLTMTLPWLSQYGGITKAAKQMAAAVVDANKKTTGDTALDAALKRAEEDGTVSPQEVHDLMRQAQGRGALQSGDGSAAGDAYAKSSNLLSRVSFAWGKLFSAAEQFNRRSTFIAAYRTAVEQGLGDPSKFAEQAIAETQGVYNKGNKPEWARGSVGSILFTFKQYSVAYVEMLSRMATAGKPGSPERATGQRSALYALGVLMLLSGAGGLPGADDLDDLISGLMQALGYNFDSKSKRKAFLVEHLGTGGADFVERGLSGLPGAPIDVSGRLGLGNLIPGTGLLTKKQDHTRDVLEFVGPAGDLFKRGFESAGKVVTGDIMGKNGAVATLAPKAMQNLFQAADMEQMGMYRDQTGKKVIDTDSGDALAKALGFQPGSVKRSQDASFEVQRMVGLNRINESRIVDKWAQGLFEKDPAKVQEARDALAQWNRDNPESPIRVKSQQIFSRVANMRMTKQQRIAKTAPAEIRREVFRELAQQ